MSTFARTAAVLTVSLLLSTATTGAVDKPASTARAQAGKTLAMTLTDAATRQPLPGVELSIRASCTGVEGKDKKTTDATGKAALTLPDAQPYYVYVTARKPGYVPMRLMWRRSGQELPDVPASYALAMEPGTKISGQVVDDAKKPIAGATVVLAIRKKDSQPVESVDVSYVDVKCDADGKWSYAQAPAKFDQIDVGAWHHDCDVTQGFFGMNEFEPIAALRDGSATITLTRGVAVEGVVYDSAGKPLPKASVGVGSDRVASNVIPAVKTDANGHYSFGAKPGSRVVLTVKAAKHAPELKEFAMADKPQHVDVHLQAGKVLEGRIVDSDGKPIPGVSLYTDTWRGHRTIGTSLSTDKDGHFIWKGAPADAVLIDIYKSGYADLRNHPLTASTQPVTLTLHKPLKVTGSVVDAQSGEPVEGFRVVQGITFDGGKRISWQRRGNGEDPVKPRPGGTFEFETTFPYPGYAIRIEADGYEPADSRIYTMDERKVDLQFKLARGQQLTGVIRTPDDKPAARAEVMLATKDSQVSIRNGRKDKYQRDNVETTADAEGKFSLPPQNEPFVLVVLHDSGQAKMSKEQLASAGGQIKLEPWSGIEGTLRVGANPGAGETLNLWVQESFEENKPRVYSQYETKADASGHFAFDRVFPGKVGVSRYIQLGPSMWGGALSKSLVVEAGKTAQVQLGGTGRPVIGRLTLPANLPQRWMVQDAHIMTKSEQARPPFPDDFAAMEPEQKKQWYEKWKSSDEGKAFEAKAAAADANRRHYSFPLKPDGTFRAEDVEPGTYTVNISLAEAPEGRQCGWGEQIGAGSAEFTIPPIAGGRSDEPFEIPSLEMKMNRTVKVGDVAPAFAVKTLDGKDLRLEDFKGKYVLLDFWATWCGPCVAEMPHLKAAYDAFGSRENFAMISLSLDEKTNEPKVFAEKQGLKWHQGFLGDWSKATLPNDYGVRGIPSVWLIGPDGKVVAKELRGDTIKTKLAEVLK